MSLTVTTANLRELLNGPSDTPVLYVARDEDTNEPVRLEVWDESLVPNGDIVVHKHELEDVLGGPSHPDGVTEAALENLLEDYQNTVAVTIDRELIPSDACIDGDGNDYPEHDYPSVGQGDECRRCGAEAEGS